jgi:hypothetical protein
MRKGIAAIAALGFGALFTGGASAATVVCGGNLNPDSYTLDAAADSAGCFGGGNAGNDKPNVPTQMLFGMTGWIGASATDEPGGPFGDQNIIITETGDNNGGAFTPTWDLDLKGATFDKIMITIKQANSYAAFLIDQTVGQTASGFAGTWGTVQNNPSNDISHMTAWYIGRTPPPIPLPAAGWLLISGVAGLAAYGCKRRA